MKRAFDRAPADRDQGLTGTRPLETKQKAVSAAPQPWNGCLRNLPIYSLPVVQIFIRLVREQCCPETPIHLLSIPPRNSLDDERLDVAPSVVNLHRSPSPRYRVRGFTGDMIRMISQLF